MERNALGRSLGFSAVAMVSVSVRTEKKGGAGGKRMLEDITSPCDSRIAMTTAKILAYVINFGCVGSPRILPVQSSRLSTQRTTPITIFQIFPVHT